MASWTWRLGLLLIAALAVGTPRAQDARDAALLEFAQLLTADAERYEHGEGVERDAAVAMQLYCRAARYGHAEAQYKLGWMLANGRGVPRDEILAAKWFSLAAEQGHEYAQRMLQFFRPSRHTPHPPCLSPEVAEQQRRAAEPASSEPQYDWVRGSASRKVVVTMVEKLAPLYGVDANFALAIISVESGFNFGALSNRSAQGLMQLIPATAARFGVRDPYDPSQNVRGGLSYLRWLLATFRGDVRLVAAGYNAGERAVEKYRDIPPYPETLDYVAKVLRLYKRLQHPYDAKIAPASAAFPAHPAATQPPRPGRRRGG